jgi:hypothetical protein
MQMRINPVKVKAWYDKAQEVRRISDSLYHFAEELKLAIVREADGKDARIEDFQNKEGGFTNGGSFLGDIEPGDWAEYTVDVTYTGIYSVDLTAARGDDEGRSVSIDLAIDGTSIATVSDILTDGWDDYKSFTGETASLTAGKHTLRVTFTGGYVNVDNIKFAEKDVDKGSKFEPTPDALAKARFVLSDKELQVFDMQGRNLGTLGVSAGMSLEEALFAKFRKPGIYLVKQGARITPVRVTR